MGKKFNILYWNIHNCGGIAQKDKYEKVSNDIADILVKTKTYNLKDRYDKKNDIKINDIKDIDAIVFTEFYPQRNVKKNCNKGNQNTILKDKLKEQGFELYQDDVYKRDELLNYNSIGIFINEKHIVKDISLRYKFTNEYPDCKIIIIENLNIALCGIRIKNDCKDENNKKIKTGEKQIKNVCKEYLKKIVEYNKNLKIVILGDFNIYSAFEKKSIDIKSEFKSNGVDINLIDTINGGTMCQSFVDSKRMLQETYTDKMLYDNDISECGVSFYKLLTIEEIYCNDEYIDELDGHIKSDFLNIVKTPYKTKNKKEAYRRQVNIQKNVNKLYKKDDIGLNYCNRCGICIKPFPDHNLLFASIEI